jgi:hypothetical protein
MHEMNGMLMPMSMEPWTPRYGLVVVAMWAVMMAAMMLPSAAPMILLYGTIARTPGGESGHRRGDGCVRVRIRGRLGSLQSRCRRPSIRARPGRAALADDGNDKHRARRICLDCGGPLSMDATEASLPSTVSLAAGVYRHSMARRGSRRLRHGVAPWRLLSRVLLASHVVALRRWRHELGVDCRSRAIRLGRKTRAGGALDRASRRRRARRLGVCNLGHGALSLQGENATSARRRISRPPGHLALRFPEVPPSRPTDRMRRASSAAGTLPTFKS